MNSLPSIKEILECIEGFSKELAKRTQSKQEIESEVSRRLGVTKDLLEIPREKSRSEFQYRLAWAMTKAKQKGLVERTGHKQWTFRDPSGGLRHDI